jgi:Ca-activated chloride channel homolog
MKKFIVLLLMLGTAALNTAMASRIVSGYVYDAATKQPVPGVPIQVENMTAVTFTDTTGFFKLTIPDKKVFLMISYAGYLPQKIEARSKATLKIYLQKNTAGLNEVIIVGPGTQQKRELVGSANYAAAVRQSSQVAAGRASAMQVKPNSYIAVAPIPYIAPGTSASIQIRGTSTFQKAEPLYVIDGVAVNAMPPNLNPDNLRKVEVLKDASATAIYGSRAANGVIIMATKNGDFPKKNKKLMAQLQRITRPVIAYDESYQATVENKFQNPKTDPLSTFSVDVDAASYSNIRRYINGGQLPPKYAVRIEEMINYFNYNLPAPTNNEPVAIHTELSSAPWNPQHRLLRIGLKARIVETAKLPPSNLVFLVDVSGSMSAANKLPLVQSSLKMLADQLRPQDKVAIVVYAGAAGMVLPPTPGSQKTVIKDAIDRLQAGGSTAGGEGIKLAYQTARANFLKEGNNRVILATDGDFNVGASSDQDMEQLIEQERKSGVFLSVLGYGMGNYKDSKMETLADKGNGNYAYIDNITEARKTLVSEFGGTLFTIAKDVKLQLEFNPAKVAAYRLIGYENRMLAKEDFNNDMKDAGDMGTGHNVTALYEVIPVGVNDQYANPVDALKYQKPEKAATTAATDEMLTIKFRYKEPAGTVSKLSQAVVMDKPLKLAATSEDFRFAASVAEVGLLLRDSEFKQNAGYEEAIKRARAAKGNDAEGYRAEFIKLAESARLLSKSALAAVQE